MESRFVAPAVIVEHNDEPVGAEPPAPPEGELERSPFANHIGKFPKGAPETSRKAAIDAYPKTGSQKHRLLIFIMRRPFGVTCDYAEAQLDIPHQTASPRWNELWHDHGLIEPNGKEEKTRNGSMAQAFVLTTKGREAMAKAGDLWT